VRASQSIADRHEKFLPIERLFAQTEVTWPRTRTIPQVGRPVIKIIGNPGFTVSIARTSSKPSMTGMPTSEIRQSISRRPPLSSSAVAEENSRTA
jgi:hypothetical protein